MRYMYMYFRKLVWGDQELSVVDCCTFRHRVKKGTQSTRMYTCTWSTGNVQGVWD